MLFTLHFNPKIPQANKNLATRLSIAFSLHFLVSKILQVNGLKKPTYPVLFAAMLMRWVNPPITMLMMAGRRFSRLTFAVKMLLISGLASPWVESGG